VTALLVVERARSWPDAAGEPEFLHHRSEFAQQIAVESAPDRPPKGFPMRPQKQFRNQILHAPLALCAALMAVAAFLLLAGAGAAPAQTGDAPLLREMKWRNIGPAVFAGRVVDVEALESDFRTVIVASASGGVWKSVNAGTTWQPIFDRYGSASIGDVALFQPDPDIIWVGTGEANNRNSVGWGDGIYLSTDGGASFTNMGLRDTCQIARIVTHPANPDIVYVAAIGNLWSYSGERGLFKTTDRGKSWARLTSGLPSDEKTGATDLLMDPANPKILYAAFYQRLRRPWRFDSGGPQGGIFKSVDEGKTWTKLSAGVPSGDTGRIGLAIYRKNPQILMAIIEHGFQPTDTDPAHADMTRLGTGIYRSEDAGKTWKFLNRYNNRPFYYSNIRINPLDDRRVYVLTTNFMISEDGGKTFKPAPESYEGGLDHHAMWLDPGARDRFYLGNDKGLKLTHDHGAAFQLFDNLPIAQFYAIGVDMREPYYVYGGTQDNGTWGGPHFSKDVRGTLPDNWWKLHWGDGMFIQIDPTDWRKVYTEAENGSARRYDALSRRVEMARPGAANVVNLRDAGLTPDRFRFNWRSPLVMSSHNPQTLFLGGNFLFRSVDGMRTWSIISPDLSTNDPLKTDTNTGGITRDVTGAETHCTIVAFSESPLDPAILWAGTDDGNVQLTRNSGATWTNVRNNIPGVPDGIWVSSLQASHFDRGTAYVTFDGHRSGDFRAWVFRTSDFGATWTNMTANLPPNESLYVVREDLKNKNLLFAGSEFSVHVSLNAGGAWTRLMNNMPTVATHDLVIHPRDGDLLAATHGRGIFVLDDITPLQQLSPAFLNAPAHIFEQRVATLWEDSSRGGARGQFYWAAENPPYIVPNPGFVRGKLIPGALINYYLKAAAAGDVTLEISDLAGALRRTLKVKNEPGIGRALWDLRWDLSPQQTEQFRARLDRALQRIATLASVPAEQKTAAARAADAVKQARTADELNELHAKLQDMLRDFPAARAALGAPAQGAPAEPGEYALRLSADGKTYSGKLILRADPCCPSPQP
jgi:photosystem II stability/assembly factor-like uncharacterized protein